MAVLLHIRIRYWPYSTPSQSYSTRQGRRGMGGAFDPLTQVTINRLFSLLEAPYCTIHRRPGNETVCIGEVHGTELLYMEWCYNNIILAYAIIRCTYVHCGLQSVTITYYTLSRVLMHNPCTCMYTYTLYMYISMYMYNIYMHVHMYVCMHRCTLGL